MKTNATKKLYGVLGSVIFLLVLCCGYLFLVDTETQKQSANQQKKQFAVKEMSRVEKKAARSEYFFRLMRDPATNKIPENIRNRELEFAKTLPTAGQALRRAKSKNPSLQAVGFDWQAAGPFDLGGRTRALAVDQRNPDIVLAGGVSGGMWKSTNGGQNWQLQTPDLSNLSVTSVAQDPLNPDTWYYASGEVLGNSANAVSAAYYGQGIYKSTDNGDTWSLMSQASSNTQGLVDVFNTVSRIRISPTTGTIFIASIGFGIYRSTDGQTFSSTPVLGTEGEQLFTDVAVGSDGTVGAAISEADFDDQGSQNPSHSHNPGIFISNNDGQAWINVTPDNFPDTYRRSVLTFAPSNPDILYVFTLKGVGDNENQGVSFFRIDISDPQNPVAEDRSANLPNFGGPVGNVNTQGGYNMMVTVKPDDPDFVLLGATNLFRSRDGFATRPSGGYDNNDMSQKDEYWIGGYGKRNDVSQYNGQHPDQHIAFFPEPQNNPNKMWAGHDGGLSLTSDITAPSVNWNDRDNGYVTSQFYAASIPKDPNNNNLVGGTQDNGSPFFQKGQPNSQGTQDISSGDGGFSQFTDNYVYVSSQLGRILRWNLDLSSQAINVSPPQAQNQLFIHPYEVDPIDENVMYYPEGDHLWRNTNLAQAGWEELNSVSAGQEYLITTLEASNSSENILYFAGYNSNLQPTIKRLPNAKTAIGGVEDISLPDNPELEGAYVKDIAVNPVNDDEVIAVLSNYGIVGLYHTTDGGENWTAIEGNLTGSPQNPGVSLRSAAIIPAEGATVYLVSSSIGVYSTQMLDGNSTVWGQEASNILGDAVTDDLDARLSDGDVVAATHGRGLFYGDYTGPINAPFITISSLEARAGTEVTIQANDFTFNTTPSENEVKFGSATANVLSATPSELEVEVPRGAVDRQSEKNFVPVTVTNENGTVSTTFEVLPPNDFSLAQNYPNPFNPTTTIPFDIPVQSEVTLTIYNMSGQKVLEPIQQQLYNPGTYTESLDLSNLASGVYIYRLYVQTSSGGDDALQTKKMTLIK